MSRLISFFLLLTILTSKTWSYFPPDDETLSLVQKMTPDSNLENLIKDKIQKLNKLAYHKQWEFVLKTHESLPNNSLAQIVPNLNDPTGLKIELHITPEGLKNPMVIMEEIIHMDQISGSHASIMDNGTKTSFTNPFHWAETVSNAEAGSLSAKKKLIAIELETQLKAGVYLTDYEYQPLFAGQNRDQIDLYLKARKNHAQGLYEGILKLEKKDLALRKKQWEIQKSQFDSLEAQEEKLNHLIAKNDRKGVRDLLSKYLPWPLMEPSEEKAWRSWLEAIENPDFSNTEVIFRGIDQETILKSADGKPYFMSTVLTKNQGNYTRRLRSLSTLREKFGQNHLAVPFSSPIEHFDSPTSLSIMMLNHAGEAKGSPFLSASNNEVAQSFGKSQRVALKIDKRRILLNSQNYNFLKERERLIPLVIFPDEVVHLEVAVKKNPTDAWSDIDDAEFIQKVEDKLGRRLTPAELSEYSIKPSEFIEASFKQTKEVFLSPSVLEPRAACKITDSSCSCLFNTLSELLK